MDSIPVAEGRKLTLTWLGVCVAHVPDEKRKLVVSGLPPVNACVTATGSPLGANIVALCAVLTTPTSVLPKVRRFGVTVGAIGSPVPVSGIALETPDVASVTVSVAVRKPVCDGVKTTLK